MSDNTSYLADVFAENLRTLDAASEAIDRALAMFECNDPAGGLGPGTHCSACCYGTGYVITCDEDDRLVRTLSAARRAIAAASR